MFFTCYFSVETQTVLIGIFDYSLVGLIFHVGFPRKERTHGYILYFVIFTNVNDDFLKIPLSYCNIQIL